MSEKAAEFHKLLKELAVESEEFGKKADAAGKSINDTADKMKQIIDKYRDKLVDELTAAKKKKRKKTEMTRHETEGRLMMIDSFVKYSDELRSKGTACDIARAASSLHDRAKELVAFDAMSEFSVKNVQLNVEFTQRVDSHQIQGIFGELKISEVPESSTAYNKSIIRG